jgi:hypothetical protein
MGARKYQIYFEEIPDLFPDIFQEIPDLFHYVEHDVSRVSAANE